VFVTQDPSGQKAITDYRVVREKDGLSLLAVNIQTGRKNQIRVQLKEYGHSIVGDEKYGFMKNPIGRLGLHASKLVFMHPFTKELITISASVPNEFWKIF
jgi:23S rRNA pseudouridine1911/1915/1917 synthase